LELHCLRCCHCTRLVMPPNANAKLLYAESAKTFWELYVVLGIRQKTRQPVWPECHLPNPVANLSTPKFSCQFPRICSRSQWTGTGLPSYCIFMTFEGALLCSMTSIARIESATRSPQGTNIKTNGMKMVVAVKGSSVCLRPSQILGLCELSRLAASRPNCKRL